MGKSRIAVLGGGMGALSALYEITSDPAWTQQFEIDVYCMGWRLGGKCASGRDKAFAWRNREHGLHVLGGFYHNTFQQLRPLYAEWNAVAPATALDFSTTFFRHQPFSVAERRNGAWHQVRVCLPEMPGEPGVEPEQLSVAGILARIWQWTSNALLRFDKGWPLLDWTSEADVLRQHGKARSSAEWQRLSVRARELHTTYAKLASLQAPGIRAMNFTPQLQLAQETNQQLLELSVGVQLFIEGADWAGVLNFLGALSSGLLADALFRVGFDAVNDLEAEAWLRKHGAIDAGANCPLFQAAYHYAFAYEDGDPSRKSIAAGAGLRGLLRMLFTYHGSVFMHMNGGMGEVMIAPYYEVLKSRGVRFHFFHRVTSLTTANGEIDSIGFSIQAQLKPGLAAYEPLVAASGIDGRMCFPIEPIAAQLDDPGSVQGMDLESWWASECVDAGSLTLEVGAQANGFDKVILAIPPSVLRKISDALAQASPAWDAMLASSASTPTVSAQIWRSDTLAKNGSDFGEDGLLTGFALPHSTWADFSFQHELEEDQATRPIATLSIFCGPCPVASASDPEDCQRPVREQARAEAITKDWLDASVGIAFPTMRLPSGKYSSVDEYDRYVRMNSDPVSLYVLTPPGSVQHRLRPHGSGFTNLFLAGDWTRNNLDMGAVECAVMGGRLCARAICGRPQAVYGEADV